MHDETQPVQVLQNQPDIIRLVVMLYVRFPLSLRNVEDILHERGIDVSHETVRFWWHRFGLMFAAEIWSGSPLIGWRLRFLWRLSMVFLHRSNIGQRTRELQRAEALAVNGRRLDS